MLYNILAIESKTDTVHKDSYLKWELTIQDSLSKRIFPVIVTSYLTERFISFQGFKNIARLGMINDTLYADALDDDHITHLAMICF